MFLHFYKHHTSKLTQWIFILFLLIVSTAPIYSPFLDRVMQKQETNIERSGSTFSSREGKWNNRLDEFEENPIFGCGFAALDVSHNEDYSAYNGVVEPGSSWLALLSMTGVMGAILFAMMFLPTISSLIKARPGTASLLLASIVFFSVHLVVEGYIFASGNYLCFLFWLILGCGISYSFSPSEFR
jgi:O-antigen ligase